MQQSLKTGLCYKCQTPLSTPISSCFVDCHSCSRTNLFLCHIIPKQISSKSPTSSKLQFECKKCNLKYTIIQCVACKGYCAIKDFINGFGYQCVCGKRGVYIICGDKGGCNEMLVLPYGKNWEKVLIRCKACKKGFLYKICNTCRACIYKPQSDTSDLFLCINSKCPQSGSGQQNVFNMNPYGYLQPQSQAINYRISQFQQQAKQAKISYPDLSQKNQTKAEPFKDMCKICMNKQAIMINTSCYHLSLCQGCANEIIQQGGKCPICRASGKYQKILKF